MRPSDEYLKIIQQASGNQSSIISLVKSLHDPHILAPLYGYKDEFFLSFLGSTLGITPKSIKKVVEIPKDNFDRFYRDQNLIQSFTKANLRIFVGYPDPEQFDYYEFLADELTKKYGYDVELRKFELAKKQQVRS